eukprot:TRINITY_DN54_c0_g1_i1.p1 TRINITY_DN54_c0_g1~~TRINITY_DN54_c0_g1_i1.p1  ORF type:complete len:419 (+),score=156.71 TRINITY_DN54_c0_g1_i1:58-1314(+)
MKALALLLAPAVAQGTFVARVHKGDAGTLRKLAAVPCKGCGSDHGLVDVWKPVGDVRDAWAGSIDVRGGEELRRALANVSHEVIHSDLEEAVRQERARVRSTAKTDWYDDYHPLDEIHTKLDEFIEDYSGVTPFSIGKSYEGRDIRGIRFGSSDEKHAVWLQCGIHAREWIAPATCMYYTQKILENLRGGDKEVAALLSKLVIYMVPVLNVDGYVYTWTTNRMWRKNRQPNSGSSFVGTDLNRNWDSHWGGCGASTSPSSDTYRGTGAFSAPETKAVHDFLAQLKADGYHVLGGHDYHSYGELILRNYGWTTEPAHNNDFEEARGAKMQAAIEAVHGMKYTNERSYDLYCHSGVASDFFGAQTTEASGFTFELRGTPGGFVLPPDQIIPSGEEIYAGLLTYFAEITYSATYRNSTKSR